MWKIKTLCCSGSAGCAGCGGCAGCCGVSWSAAGLWLWLRSGQHCSKYIRVEITHHMSRESRLFRGSWADIILNFSPEPGGVRRRGRDWQRGGSYRYIYLIKGRWGGGWVDVCVLCSGLEGSRVCWTGRFRSAHPSPLTLIIQKHSSWYLRLSLQFYEVQCVSKLCPKDNNYKPNLSFWKANK